MCGVIDKSDVFVDIGVSMVEFEGKGGDIVVLDFNSGLGKGFRVYWCVLCLLDEFFFLVIFLGVKVCQINGIKLEVSIDYGYKVFW